MLLHRRKDFECRARDQGNLLKPDMLPKVSGFRSIFLEESAHTNPTIRQNISLQGRGSLELRTDSLQSRQS
jgi:hypothetical protein